MKITLAALVLGVRIVYAANDWSVPCTSSVCAYDLPVMQGSPSGTLKIWGPQGAISDITPAAGWHILGCDKTAMEQDIRLICASASAPCDHLFAEGGAEGKIVRLPENCGKNAFARVARAWIPNDQSIPDTVAAHIRRRDGKLPQVQALRFDTQFHEVDTNKIESINFAIQATSIPGLNHDIDTQPRISPRSRHLNNQSSFGDIVNNSINSIKGMFDFHFDKSASLGPIDIDANAAVFKAMIDCPPLSPGIEIDMDAKAHAQVMLGIAISGKIAPPSVKDFGVIIGISADIEGTMTLQADVLATLLDSGKIKIFEVPLSGLDFPGIFSVGPTFQINVQVKTTLDLAVGTRVGINYHLDQAQVVFPPREGQDPTVNDFGLHDTPLELSATPFVKATGAVEGHVIPSLNLGVNAFNQEVGVFAALDSSVVYKISLEGDKPALRARQPAAVTSEERRALPTTLSGLEERAGEGNVAFNGCFEIDTVLDFNVGADATFFNLFDATVKISFLKIIFPLFKACKFSNLLHDRSLNLTCSSALEYRHLPRGNQSVVEMLLPSTLLTAAFQDREGSQSYLGPHY